MVWAFISYCGIPKIIKVDGSVNSPVYCQILQDRYLPYAFHEWILQQDRAPAHTARTRRDCHSLFG